VNEPALALVQARQLARGRHVVSVPGRCHAVRL
jgi:hypothetical protein